MASVIESQSNIKIRQIEFRTLVHATESTEKVANVLLNLVSDEITEKNLEIEILKGTFGQEIINITLILKKSSHIAKFIHFLAENLKINDKKQLETEFLRRLDEKLKFYLRIDKQLATFGKITLADQTDVIQVTISNANQRFNTKSTPDEIYQFYKLLSLI